MRVAVLGLGFMGSTHLKAIRKARGVELAGVCSADERKLSGDLTGIQGNFGGPGEKLDFSNVKKFSEIEAVLSDPDIDAVDICLPTDMHAAVAVEALRSGKHVLVEKPMALDGYSADRMVQEAEKNGRILMTAQVLRFHPDYIALREAVNQGQLGLARTAIFRRRCAAPAWGKWLKDPQRSGGGVFDLLIHDVDMCLHLFGPPESIAASGYENYGIGVDIIHAELYYPHGGGVIVTGGWHHPESYPFSMEYTVTCDGGTIEFNSEGRPPTLYAADGKKRELPVPAADAYAAEIEHFAECCASGTQSRVCPPAESAAAVKLMRLMLDARNKNGEKISCDLYSRWKSA
jgi:predicted dehydrogenase